MPFYPFGPPPEGRDENPRFPAVPGMPGFPGAPPVDAIVEMAKQSGMIPPDVSNDQIMVVRMGISMEFMGSPGDGVDEDLRWHPGEPLPHTSHDFSDPPYAVSPDEWRETLFDAVNRAEDQDDFRFALMSQLGYDQVHSHGVPPDTALDGCGEFADWLYTEFRHAAQHD